MKGGEKDIPLGTLINYRNGPKKQDFLKVPLKLVLVVS